MPHRNTDAMKRLRATWKARGLCTRCGCDKDPGRSRCRHCRHENAAYMAEKRRNTTLQAGTAEAHTLH
jgi:hypothetical protein